MIRNLRVYQHARNRSHRLWHLRESPLRDDASVGLCMRFQRSIVPSGGAERRQRFRGPMLPRLLLAALFLLLAACGPSRGDLETVCTAYSEAVERLAELGDTVLVDAEARVQADRICDET